MWDEYSRSEAIALIERNQNVCVRCGQTRGLVRIKREDRYVNAPDGSRWLVKGWRCVACMALDIRERDMDRRDREITPTTGSAMPGDGRRLTVHRADRR